MQAELTRFGRLRQQQGGDRARGLAVLRARHHRARRPAVPRSRRAARRRRARRGRFAVSHPILGPRCCDFARFLGARGIRLVLFPVPDKAALQPIELHGRARDGGGVAARAQPRCAPARGRAAPRRACWCSIPRRPRFARQPAALPEARHPLDAGLDGGGRRRRWPRFLTAHRLRLASGGARPGVASGRQDGVARRRRVDMLGLPEGQTLFSPEVQALNEVQDATGAPFEPSDKAVGAAARRQLHQRVQPRADGLGHERGVRRRSSPARSIATST